jgi:hypothetical protein
MLVSAAPASARPNLAVRSVSSPPKSAQPFGTFTVRDRVAVSGKASKRLNVEYLLSKDRRRSATDIPLLGARSVAKRSGRATVALPGGVPAGRWYLLACADPGGLLKERSEQDNCKAAGRRIRTTALPHRKRLDAKLTLDRTRAASLPLLRDTTTAGPGGTGAASATATGPDGTRYVLKIPRDAGVLFVPLTLTPVTRVTGIPGAGRVMGVEIGPADRTLMSGATLTVIPKKALSPRRAVAVATATGGRNVHLSPLTGKPRSFTFAVNETGGYLLLEGRPGGGGATAAAGSVSQRDLFSRNVEGTRAQNAQRTAQALSDERQRQLLGSEDDDGQSAILDQAAADVEADANAVLARVERSPTFPNWVAAIRDLTNDLRQLGLMGADDDASWKRLHPRLVSAYRAVLDRLHACGNGMPDVLALGAIHSAAFLRSYFELPADASTACTRYRVGLRGSDRRYDADLNTDSGIDVAVAFPPKPLFDYTVTTAPGAYSNGVYKSRDNCWQQSSPPVSHDPWELAGQTTDFDTYLKSGDPSTIGLSIVVEPGDATMSWTGDGCAGGSPYTESGTFTVDLPLASGTPLTFAGKGFTGIKRSEDKTAFLLADVTAVP